MVLAKRVGKRVVTMVLSMSYFKCFLVCCFCLYPRVVGNELRSLYSSPKISGRKIKSQAFFPLYTTEKDWSCDRVYVHLLLSKSKMHNGIFYILKKNHNSNRTNLECRWRVRKAIPRVHISRALSFLSLPCRSFAYINLPLSQKYAILTIFCFKYVSDFQY